MGTASGANFQHQQPAPQVEMPPPPLRVDDRAPPSLQTSLSLSGGAGAASPPDTQESLSNSDPGHDSATERAGSGEPGECGGGPPVVAAPMVADKEEEVAGNAISEIQSVRRPPSAGSMTTLREVAGGRVDLVAEKLNAMSEELLEELKSELRLILQGIKECRHVDEFLCLQELVQGRAGLTSATLAMSHLVQLQVLVAIKTRNPEFVDPVSTHISQSHLAEILLHKRCRNIKCLNDLPGDGCRCSICVSRSGFCNSCMCIICSQFDLAANSCRWVGCDSCCHWSHTDCAIRDGHVKTGPHSTKGSSYMEMLYWCQSCSHTSELMGYVQEVFQCCSHNWSRDAMLRELSYVIKVFHLSEDPKGWQLFRRCADLVERLQTGSVDESMCSRMLLQMLQEISNQENEHEALERVLVDANAEPIKLSYTFFKNITNDFSRVIGSGGFGVVYMGVLRHKKVAVKMLFETVGFHDKQFEDELICLRSAKHKNIVRCLGYCFDAQGELVPYNGKCVLGETRRRLLCFEYLPNKSLHDYLEDGSHGYEWATRYQLIEGICQGVRYLHSVQRINHLDLKPENILLDADMVPKIADFGLSRRFSGEQSRLITENIRGSWGYIAPEYRSRGEISFKADIFSLGVIIRKLSWGSNYPSDLGNVMEIFIWHHSLDIGNAQVKKCIEIAQLCVGDDPHKRPTIDCIIDMLSGKETLIEIVSPASSQSRNKSSEEQELIRGLEDLTCATMQGDADGRGGSLC